MSTEFKSDQTPHEPLKLDPGKWDGEYIDVKGVRGTLRLNIESGGETIAGSYELMLRVRDHPQVHSGRLDGKIENGLVQLELTVDKKGGGSQYGEFERGTDAGPQKMHYEAQLKDAGSFARQSLFGLARTSPDSDSGGGVWIAWRFDRPQ